MKTALLISVLFTGLSSWASTPAAKSYVFKFKTAQNQNFSITQAAHTQEEAYRLAARECFKKLTGNHYPGEEKGMEIIDICANPKM